MVCAMLSSEPTGLFAPAEAHQKRKEASNLNEIGNCIQNQMHQAVQKRIKLESMPLIHSKIQCATQGKGVQQDVVQFSQQSTGRPIVQAFYLLSECERDYLQDQLAKETTLQPNHQYLHLTQYEVDAHKRFVLVDWLIEVVDEFGLSQETLYLAISLLDRFLSVHAVPRCQLQLLGVTCLWVAAKYEEVMPPALQDFVEITDNSYAAADLIRMEAVLLSQLRYELAVPTSLHFLHQLLSHAQAETGCASPRGPCHPLGADQERLVHMAEYLLELALLTPETLRYRPSVVAASALQSAVHLLGHSCSERAFRAACSNLCKAISVSAATQLDACVAELMRMHRWAGSALQPPCVKDKYSDVKHSYVASLNNLATWQG